MICKNVYNLLSIRSNRLHNTELLWNKIRWAYLNVTRKLFCICSWCRGTGLNPRAVYMIFTECKMALLTACFRERFCHDSNVFTDSLYFAGDSSQQLERYHNLGSQLELRPGLRVFEATTNLNFKTPDTNVKCRRANCHKNECITHGSLSSKILKFR